ncbi:MAG TPA: hypothetical protein DCG69_05840 [Bacteroidales bacterium]|nr:hypothetical protein [Bacteroidales bacterium]
MDETQSKNNRIAPNTKEEDVDLGVLFNLLKAIFVGLFNSILGLFIATFNVLIRFLIYLKKHFLKLFIFSMLGLVLGGIYQYKFKEPIYTSSMTVQANYESIVQLYKDIEYCDGLIAESDRNALSLFFGISSADAASIKNISVSPYTNDNQIVLAYNDFISKLDSNVIKNVDFEKFGKNIPKEEFKYHVINVESTNKTLFFLLEKPIIQSIAKNPFYSKLKETEIGNLKSQEKVLNISMQELDSLRQFYKELSLIESKKEKSNMSFYMGNTEKNDREIVVFDKYIQANIDLVDVRSEMNFKDEIINVVSSFNKSGAPVKGWYRNSMIIGFFVGILLVLIYLSVVEFNRFLIGQEKNRKKS